MNPVPLQDWPERVEQAFAVCNGLFHRVTVLRETGSTQDAARRQGTRAGEVVTAWRQTAGRGRLGRAWADTVELGVAMTCVMPGGASERLSAAGAVGTAIGIESVLKREVGIKWPNDIVIDGRKLAGILIEQQDGLALVGIGINVHQTEWPAELAERATSLKEAGVLVDRIGVIVAVLAGLSQAWLMDDAALKQAFAQRGTLAGCRHKFRVNGQVIEGRVLEVDPFQGLRVQQGTSDLWLPAALTSVVQDGHASGR